MFSELVCISSFKKNFITVIIFVNQRFHIAFADCLNCLCDLVNRICVDLPSEFDLSFYLVTFCYSNISHIVCNSHDTHMTALDNTYSSAHPGCNFLLYIFICPVPHNNLALNSKTAEDMAVLTIAVSGLVLVHKVHINSVIRNLLIELSVQMKQRFSVFLEAENPGFCR